MSGDSEQDGNAGIYRAIKLICIIGILLMQIALMWSTHERIKAIRRLEQRLEQIKP